MGDFEVSTGSFNKTLKLGTVHICQQGSSSYTPGGLTYHILRHCALSRFSGLHVDWTRKTPKTGHPVSEQTWFHQILEIEKKSSSHTEREDRCEFGTL